MILFAFGCGEAGTTEATLVSISLCGMIAVFLKVLAAV